MKEYVICVDGCDDETNIYEFLTDEEFELLSRIAKKITNTSTCVCMPIMAILEVKENK